MRGAVLYAPHDVRIDDRAEAGLVDAGLKQGAQQGAHGSTTRAGGGVDESVPRRECQFATRAEPHQAQVIAEYHPRGPADRRARNGVPIARDDRRNARPIPRRDPASRSAR